MGRLYDRKDLEFNLWYWHRKEQEMHADIANGVLSASVLDEVITEKSFGAFPPKVYKVRDGFDLQRQRERMKLLRTGTLIRELERWQAMFKACPHCKEMKKKDGGLKQVPCIAHKEGLDAAKSAVYWAGENNIAERNSRGQRRVDDGEISTALETLVGTGDSGESGLNEWEKQYFQEKSSGNWKREDANLYEVEPDYEGFLEMLLQNEEISGEDYANELQRLKRTKQEQLEAAPQWAGHDVTVGARRQGERFRRDTRYNLAG